MFLTSPPYFDQGLFEKKAAAGKKFSGSLFFQKFCGFWKKNVKKLTVFSGFQCLHNEKKAAASEKFANPFSAPEVRQKFSEYFFIFVRGPILQLYS